MINAKDKRPPISEMVLFYKNGFDHPLLGWRVEDDLYRCSGSGPYYDNITHWQPLPEIPKQRFSYEWTKIGHVTTIDGHTFLGGSIPNMVDWLNDLIEKGILKVECLD